MSNAPYRELHDYLSALGLGGNCLLLGPQEKSITTSLEAVFSPEKVKTYFPSGDLNLSDFSVIVADIRETEIAQQLSSVLTRSAARPIIIYTSNASETDTARDFLTTFGYSTHQSGKNLSQYEVMSHFDSSHKSHFDVGKYWETRYASGRDSGVGSYGRLARFKADFINEFVRKNDISTVVEFGCGDGAQAALSNYKNYIGLDISPTVVELCSQKFSHDQSKSFIVYDPEAYKPGEVTGDLAISLDVTYHLSSDRVYKHYIDHLFNSSSKFVILYTNVNKGNRPGVDESAGYMRFRDTLQDISIMMPEWRLSSLEPNRFPYSVADPDNTSFADFLIYERVPANESAKGNCADLDEFLIKKIANTLSVLDESNHRLQSDLETINKAISTSSKLALEEGSLAGRLQSQLESFHEKHHELTDAHFEALKKLGNLENRLTTAASNLEQKESELKKSNDFVERLLDSEKENLQRIDILETEKNTHAEDSAAQAEQIRSLSDTITRTQTLLQHSRQELDRAKRNYQSVINSYSYKIGYDLVHALIQPGKNTLLFPFRFAKHLKNALSNNNAGTTSGHIGPQDSETENRHHSSTEQTLSATEPVHAKPISAIRAACIFDDFTFECYSRECDLIPLSLDSWRNDLENGKPDLLFVESAWRGNGGQWEYKIGKYANQDGSELREVVSWCKDNKIPTVFWNKEDPVSFDKFIDAAKQFDFIFTTDSNCIDRYKELAGHNNVFTLMFSAQPSLHNPIEQYQRESAVCFAGSYYKNVFEERKRDMARILDHSMAYGLVIYDRNYERNLDGETDFSFPVEYRDCIRGSLPYSEMDKAYKGFKFTLNVNSVKDSPTMFSRRVFESLACGTPVLTTPSLGTEKTFGDLIQSCAEGTTQEEVLGFLREKKSAYDKRVARGIREIYDNHLYHHRFTLLLNTCGVPFIDDRTKYVTAIGFAHSARDIEAIVSTFSKQSLDSARLVIVAEGIQDIAKEIRDHSNEKVKVFDSYSAGSLKLNVTDVAPAGYIAPLSPKAYYGRHYLKDLSHAAVYSRAKIVGKPDGGDEEYTFVSKTRTTMAIIDTNLFSDTPLTSMNSHAAEDSFTDTLISSDMSVFAIHRFDFHPNASELDASDITSCSSE